MIVFDLGELISGVRPEGVVDELLDHVVLEIPVQTHVVVDVFSLRLAIHERDLPIKRDVNASKQLS